VHEASNRRRWWFRHKAKETSIEPNPDESRGSAFGHSVVDKHAGLTDALYDEPADGDLLSEAVSDQTGQHLRNAAATAIGKVSSRHDGRSSAR